MPVESLFERLEPLLPQVSKPIQYVGGELNSRVKEWDSVSVRWALMYPDAYEVGLPNQGVQILYEVLNERSDALAERTYAVWPDLEALMREHGIGQFTVDAHRPVAAFDLLGVSFSTELGYTNLLTALDLAGIPLHAADRDDTPPDRHRRRARRVQPRADRRLHRRCCAGRRRADRRCDHRRRPRLRKRDGVGGATNCWPGWPATGGVYVPRFYDVTYLPDGRIETVNRQPGRRPRARQQAHRHGSRRVALPEDSARAACRVGARAHVASRSSAAARAAAASARQA